MFKKLATFALLLLFVAPGLLLAATPVNINKADAAAIAKALDRIGQSKAVAIVAYREAHGPFKKVEDLGHVKGIGKATIELNRSAILLADDTDTSSAPAATADAPAKPAHKSRKKAATAAAAAETE
ncbi:MAG: helix-hairpin-helix domain-containing protein [Rhodanobacter sp.]